MTSACRIILTATLALLTSLSAHAQADYPSKPIRLVIPYAPGGGTDNTSRMVAKAMSAQLGQSVSVDNKPGGGTIIGAMEVVRAPADGYTLFWSDNTTYAANPFLHKKLPYTPLEDFAPITRTLSGSLVLAVHPSLPLKSVSEFVAYAKAKFWHVLSAPAGTPKPILDKIRDAYAKALRDPEVVNFAATTILGSQLLVTTADAARAHIVKESAAIGPLIKSIGLTID